MKKEMGLLILFGSVMLSACDSDSSVQIPQESASQPSSVQVNAPNDQDGSSMNFVCASEDQKVKLYATTDSVMLDINGKQKDFHWNLP